jgi:DNA polymerase
MSRKSLLAAYLRQQRELSMPNFPMSLSFDLKGFVGSIAPPPLPAKTAYKAGPVKEVRPVARPVRPGPAPAAPANVANPYTRLSRLKPLGPAAGESGLSIASRGGEQLPIASLPRLTFEQKRSVFKELYSARCAKCPLSASRKSFVFGAGNVDAPLMLVGEAPGADEDAQGVPFVGAAGKLLSELLEAASLDRKKDVFITNILKCRPPSNRTPNDAEIVACLPLLHRQIEVVAPAILLLLGKTAGNALLGTGETLGAMRRKKFDYRGIPTFVTYHPAALLRTAAYRADTEADLQRVVLLLKEASGHAV